MKKKIFLGLLLFVALFTITGCGSDKEINNNTGNNENLKTEERESIKNQQGYQEGQYSIDNLTFSLPEGYELDGDNRYTYRSDPVSALQTVFPQTRPQGKRR